MGASHGDFVKYPRTPHLFGSKGTDDDKQLSEKLSEAFLREPSLIVEEKIDGTNAGIHFTADARMVLQCRGHEIREGMHPQYDLFKQWAAVKRNELEDRLADRFILFGEWVYARHTIYYQSLPHYFLEFDIYDKQDEAFLSLDRRLDLLDGSSIQTVPIVHSGVLKRKELNGLIGRSQFDSQFEDPDSGQVDDLMEGLYLRTEQEGVVSARAKFVRPEFVEKIKQSKHWQNEPMVPNQLADDVDIWA